MAGSFAFRSHPAWEDWANLILGILIGIAPWAFGQSSAGGPTVNAVVIGVIIVVMALFEFFDQARWEEVISLLAGIWLLASPTAMGYGGRLAETEMVLGALVVLLAALELWQASGRGEETTRSS